MRYLHVILMSLLVVLTGCGNDEEFVINCEIRGLGSTGVEMYYTSRGIQHSSFHPVDGKVALHGVSSEPTLVEVYTMDNQPLFSCVARNGDEISVKMEMDKPSTLKIKGNDASEQYARFVAENDSLLRSNDVAAINALVADEVRRHPDRMSSALLLVTRFNARGYELEADSLINTLKPEARANGVTGAYPRLVGEQVSTSARGAVKPMTIQTGRQNRRDTVVRYWPSNQSYSLIVVTGNGKGDSVRRVLRELTKSLHERRFKALELAAMGDSTSWAIATARDSAKWMQGWLPGSVASPAVRALAIPSVPFFIVTDSTGRQIYRGHSIVAAEDTVKARLERFLKSGDGEEPDNDTAGETAAPAASAVKADDTRPAKARLPRPELEKMQALPADGRQDEKARPARQLQRTADSRRVKQ